MLARSLPTGTVPVREKENKAGKHPLKLRVDACVHHADTINSVMHAYPRIVGAMTIEQQRSP